jgi:predicted permease
LLKIVYLLVPLFTLPVLGWLLKRYRFFSEHSLSEIKKFLYWISLPALLINRISSGSSPGKAFPVSFALIVAMLSVILVALLLSFILRMRATERATFIQGSYRGNLAYVGIPLVVYGLKVFYPDTNVSFTPELVLAPVVPLYNIVAVFLFSFKAFKKGGDACKALLQFFKNLLINPLILGSLMGLFLSFVKIPSMISPVIELLGRPALPLALIAVGASIDLSKLKGSQFRLLVAVILKGAISPLICWGVGMLMNFNEFQMLAAMLFGACPTAISSYILAEKMGEEGEFASSIVMLSTLVSLIVFPVVLILYSFQYNSNLF